MKIDKIAHENSRKIEQLSDLISPQCDIIDITYNQERVDASFYIVKCVKKFIEENRTKKITSIDICKALAFSRSHISHRFKNLTGMSIREYLTMLRINDAKHLLEYSELTVTEIAFTVGFGYPNHFSNVFKKEAGISPSAYKKQMRKQK